MIAVGGFAVLAVLMVVVGSSLLAVAQSDPASVDWRQWGGPHRNFMSDATGLADSWGDSGPPLIWSRTLGLGHSAIVVDDGTLYTLYRPGVETGRRGGWEQEGQEQHQGGQARHGPHCAGTARTGQTSENPLLLRRMGGGTVRTAALAALPEGV